MTTDPKPRPSEYVPPKEIPTTPNPQIPEWSPERTEKPEQNPEPEKPLEKPYEEPTRPDRKI